jgi:hypothetical protein
MLYSRLILSGFMGVVQYIARYVALYTVDLKPRQASSSAIWEALRPLGNRGVNSVPWRGTIGLQNRGQKED